MKHSSPRIINQRLRAVAEILRRGGVGVVPTDTLYGLVGSAFSPQAVERIYRLRRRDKNKPMIVLISSWNDLRELGIKIDFQTKKLLNKFWPEKFSVILPSPGRRFVYLHRGSQTVACRWPKKKSLLGLLSLSGPLVAPSANLAGQPPATTIAEAKKYFGDRVDFYLPAGRLVGPASVIVKPIGAKFKIIRPGPLP